MATDLLVPVPADPNVQEYNLPPSSTTTISLERHENGHVDPQQGPSSKEVKVVLKSNSWLLAWELVVHILPVMVTILVAFLNLHGYFVGSSFVGSKSPAAQAFDIFCLQAVAKIQEMLVVGSMALLLMDSVRKNLLDGSDGLPLGILASPYQFTDFKYLFSSEFWHGLWGITSYRKQLWFFVLILTSISIAVLAGPSTALLVVPTVRDQFLVEKLSFWIAGDENDLWPSRLTRSSIGGFWCGTVNPQILEAELLNSSGCIWAGLPALSESFKEAHFGIDRDISFYDGVVERQMYLRPRGPYSETWTTGSGLAAAVLAKDASLIWWKTISASPKTSSNYNLTLQEKNGTTNKFSTWAPAVRTACNASTMSTSSTLGSMLQYPGTPEYDFERDLGYLINTNFSFSPLINTQWVSVPEIAQLSNGSSTIDVPSALFFVTMPLQNASSTGTVFACSVDARWAMSTHQGSQIGNAYIQQAQPRSIRRPLPKQPGSELNFLPIDDNSWRKVQIDMDWLAVLTSTQENGTDTFSSLLANIGFDNSTGGIFRYADLSTVLESVAATLVTDGMSRVGYTANGGNITHISDAETLVHWTKSDFNESILLQSKFSFDRPQGAATNIDLSLFHAGYAYHADSIIYYLALLVLFLHAAMAFIAISIILWERVYSSSWTSLMDLFVLAATSEVSDPSKISDSLANSSSGIKTNKTYRTAVRLRALDRSTNPSPSIRNDIKILLGEEQAGSDQGYRKMKPNETYR